MNKITDLTQVGLQSLVALGQSLMSALPNILGAIFLLLLGWLIAKIMAFVTRRTLRVLGFDKLSKKLHFDEIIGDAKIDITPSHIVGKFVYWVIILLFFVTASDTLGWLVVSSSISDLLTYLPQLFSAIVVFVIGFYIANFVRKGLRGILDTLAVASARIISGFAFYLIVVIVSLAALNQAGVDTNVLTSNVTVIVGGIVLAFAVSFGIGSRDILRNILSSFYSKNNFEVGQEIEIGDMAGVISKIDITSCILKTKNGSVVIPVSTLLTEVVKMK
ncbi:MAG: mechanosensitive ion channel domain-containing protein [Cyclobacteriaceae bacterium]